MVFVLLLVEGQKCVSNFLLFLNVKLKTDENRFVLSLGLAVGLWMVRRSYKVHNTWKGK